MSNINSRVSSNGDKKTILSRPPTFGSPILIPRSPSVPAFHGSKQFSTYNVSDPILNRKVYDDHINLQNSEISFNKGESSPTKDVSSSLSLIDLYGDEDSQLASDESDDDEQDEISIKDTTPAESANPINSTDSSSNKKNRTESFIGTSKLNYLSQESDSFDRYGFKKQTSYVTEEEYSIWWKEYHPYCIRRKNKWLSLMEKHGLLTNDETVSIFPPQSEKLKRYVRKGIPAEWRGQAWWYFSKGQVELDKNEDMYSNLIVKIEGIMLLVDREKQYPDLEIIERDLNRTFPDNIHFQKEPFQTEEPEMIKSLRRVLLAFSLYNPKIGYCQSMNFLAGLLLLFLDEEKSFWMLVIITSRYLPGVHNVNLEGVNIDQGVLMLCVQEYLPEIWDYIEPSTKQSKSNLNRIIKPGFNSNNGSHQPHKNDFLFKLPPVTLCTASWFMSCFVGVLPIETTLRIWDCLFYEESHFLFKVSLGILKLSENELLKGKHHTSLTHYSIHNNQHKHRTNNPEENEMELFQTVQAFPKKLVNPNEIFEKIIFKKRITFNSLDQPEVDRCRKYVSEQRNKFKRRNETVNFAGNTQDKGDHTPNSVHKKGSIGSNTFYKGNSESRLMSQEHLSKYPSETYGFKRSVAGVNWNNSLKERVRFIRKKKDKAID